jgi:hypothetical protein
VDHTTNHIDIQLDKSNCVVKYSFPPEPDHPDKEEWTERRVRRLEEFERDRHRLPPFIVLPLPGPFKHVRPAVVIYGADDRSHSYFCLSSCLLSSFMRMSTYPICAMKLTRQDNHSGTPFLAIVRLSTLGIYNANGSEQNG